MRLWVEVIDFPHSFDDEKGTFPRLLAATLSEFGNFLRQSRLGRSISGLTDEALQQKVSCCCGLIYFRRQ